MTNVRVGPLELFHEYFPTTSNNVGSYFVASACINFKKCQSFETEMKRKLKMQQSKFHGNQNRFLCFS